MGLGSDPLGIEQEIEVWPMDKQYMHNPESFLDNEMHKVLRDLVIQIDHLISARQPDLVIINKNERTCQIGDFAVLTDYRVKLKESKKINI